MMRNLILILGLITVFVACEDEPEKQPEVQVAEKPIDSIQNFQGNLISVGNEAVFKGDQFVYQVEMDSVAKSLIDSLSHYTKTNKNVYPLEIKGKVIENIMQTGYSKSIEIKEIVEIFASRRAENKEIEN